MRVLLLNPNFTIKKESRDDFSFFPPLGLGYLAALLEPKGHAVEIIDLNLEAGPNGGVVERDLGDGNIRYGMTEEQIEARIRAFAPDVIGVSSIFTPFYRDAMRVCAAAKRVAPQALTVIGGAHASMEYKEVIQTPEVDVVIRGEGELPFTGLIDRLSSGGDWRAMRGVVSKGPDGAMIDSGMGEQVKNLDDLPFPAYHLLKMDFYTSRKDRNFAYSMRFPIGHMITSRGCPYNCVFCSTRNFFPNYRVNSPERVLAEIELLREKYGVREIHFHDDAFLIQRDRVRKICAMLEERHHDLRWQISQGVNLNLVDEDLLKVMARSGMYRMGLPIESGSEKTLQLIRKRIKLDHALKIIDLANRLGVYTHANFIIGFPFETAEEIKKTHDFAAKCGVDFLKMLICQPLAGSELYKVYQSEGLLDDLKHSSTYTSTEYNTSHFTAAQLNEMRKQVLVDYNLQRIKRVLSPMSFIRTILPKIRNLESFRYAVRLAGLQVRAMVGANR